MTMLRQLFGMLFFVLIRRDSMFCVAVSFCCRLGNSRFDVAPPEGQLEVNLYEAYVCEGIGQYMRVLLHEHKDLDLQSKGLYLAC